MPIASLTPCMHDCRKGVPVEVRVARHAMCACHSVCSVRHGMVNM